MVSLVASFIKDPSGSLMGFNLSGGYVFETRLCIFFIYIYIFCLNLFSKEKSRRVRESMKFIVEENDAFFPFFSPFFFFFVENLIRHWLALTILSVTVLMMKFNFLWGKKRQNIN